MKILLIADEEEKSLWDYYTPQRLEGADLILSAGDLKPEYLSFLVTMANRPLLYVHGNHDQIYEKRPPEGCDCIDGRLIVVNGVRILGLGGCMGAGEEPYHYSERTMRKKLRRLRFALWKHRGVDIVLTHAPAQGCGDLPDAMHRGFACFTELIDKYEPAYFVYGHVHQRYTHSFQRTLTRGKTRIVSASGKYFIDFPPAGET